MSEWISGHYDEKAANAALERLERVLEVEAPREAKNTVIKRETRKNRIRVALATVLLLLTAKTELQNWQGSLDDARQRDHVPTILIENDDVLPAVVDEERVAELLPPLVGENLDEIGNINPPRVLPTEVLAVPLVDPVVTVSADITLTPIPSKVNPSSTPTQSTSSSPTSTLEATATRETPTPTATEVVKKQQVFDFVLSPDSERETESGRQAILDSFDRKYEIIAEFDRVRRGFFTHVVEATYLSSESGEKVEIAVTTDYIIDPSDPLGTLLRFTMTIPTDFSPDKDSGFADRQKDSTDSKTQRLLKKLFTTEKDELDFRIEIALISGFIFCGDDGENTEVNQLFLDPLTGVDSEKGMMLADIFFADDQIYPDRLAIFMGLLNRGIISDELTDEMIYLIDSKYRAFLSPEGEKQLDKRIKELMGMSG